MFHKLTPNVIRILPRRLNLHVAWSSWSLLFQIFVRLFEANLCSFLSMMPQTLSARQQSPFGDFLFVLVPRMAAGNPFAHPRSPPLCLLLRALLHHAQHVRLSIRQLDIGTLNKFRHNDVWKVK